MSAAWTLRHGNEFPYDATDAWWQADGEKAPAAKDWAHSAARGVLADLTDRRSVKQALGELDEDVRIELTKSMAAIIRLAGKDRK